MPRDVDRPAEHVRRGVADERNAADIGQFLELRSLDGVVRRHVHVRGAGREVQLGLSRNARVALALVVAAMLTCRPSSLP